MKQTGASFWAQGVIVLCLILFLRLPFLNQAIQGDDFYYLKGAEHALVDPLHPTHARYVFLRQEVDMRGHPHPPLNAWYLAALVAVLGGEPEIPLHAAYILFSAIAALSALAIARRLASQPLAAAILFLLTPAFVVNGNSLESDLPFLAFWLAAIACFLYERWWLAATAGFIAALAAYQAIVLVPVLAAWLLLEHRKRSIPAVIAVLAAPAAIAAYQAFERLSSGALPAAVLTGYMQSYNLQALAQKARNAAALAGHMAWLVGPLLALLAFWRSPLWARAAAALVTIAAAIADPNPLFWVSAGVGTLVILTCASAWKDFLSAWVLLFFAAALVIFFAGSARYLLPIALPVAILATNRIRSRPVLIAGAALQAILSLGLAIVNYQHWGAYRDFARSLAPDIQRHRTWTNAEWGLRHYLEQEGAMPVVQGRSVWPNDLVVTTAFAEPVSGPMAVLAERDVTSPIPLRIVAPGVDSAYSSISFGLASFGVSTGPVDHIRAMLVSSQAPRLSRIDIGTPQAGAQIVDGVYNNDRWTAQRATVVLKRTAQTTTVEARIFIPPQSPARTVTLLVNGRQTARETYAGPGAYTLEAPLPPGPEAATVTLELDKTFTVPPDQRQLGVLLLSVALK